MKKDEKRTVMPARKGPPVRTTRRYMRTMAPAPARQLTMVAATGNDSDVTVMRDRTIMGYAGGNAHVQRVFRVSPGLAPAAGSSYPSVAILRYHCASQLDTTPEYPGSAGVGSYT